MADILPIRTIRDTGRWAVPNLATMQLDLQRGQLLATTRRDARALDLETGKEKFRFESDGRPDLDRSFFLSVRAQRAAALLEHELITWDTTTGRIVSRVEIEAGGSIDSISDDGRLAAISIVVPAAEPDGQAPFFGLPARILVIEVATGRVRHTVRPIVGAMARATILDGDGRLLHCDRDGVLREFDDHGREVREHAALPVEAPPEGALGFGMGMNRMAQELIPLAGSAVLIRSMGESAVRDRVTGARLWAMGPSVFESITVSSDRRLVYRRSTSPQSMESVHDAITGAQTRLAGYGIIDWTNMAEEDGVIASADYSGNIRVLRKGDLRSLANPLDRIPAQPESIAISRDGERIVVGSYDCSIRVIEGDRIRALPGHTGTGAAAGFLEDGRLWTSSSDHHRVWSRAERIEVEEAFLGSTYVNPQSTTMGRFLFGVRDASVTVRNATTGRLHRDRVLGVTSLRDGGGLLDDGITYFTVTDNSVARVNLDTGERTAELFPDRFEEQTYGGLIAAPDATGARVFLYGTRLTYLWEPDADTLRVVPSLHRVVRARFHGRWVLATGRHADDQEHEAGELRIHVIDASSLERVDVLTGFTEPIRAFHSSGELVAAVGEDRSVRVWRLGLGG